MAKTLDEILRDGNSRLDPAAIRAIQEQAKKAGLTKRTIHIELDMLTGAMNWQSSPMDNVTHLGMIEFYKTAIVSEIIRKPLSKAAPEAEAPAPEAPAQPEGTPPVLAPEGDAPSA